MQNIKKVFTFMVLLIVVSSIFGQVPSSFKYQAVLRDARGNIKANIATQITISVLKENAKGTVVFSETHDAITDGYGLINLEIGKGTPTVGTLSDIDWGVSTYFIKVNVDGVEMGTSQLLSVPYALYAKTAGNVTGNITETDPVFTGSQAAIITANHITKLNNLSGVNTGDQNLSGLATTASLTSTLGNKVDKVAGKGLSANDYTNTEKTKLSAINGTNTGDQDIAAMAHSNRTALDAVTGKNTGDQNLSGLATISSVTTTLNNKVDKVAGKGLSANDYTTAEKTKLTAITGSNTGDQDVTAMTHSNRAVLDSVSGKNTGDQDLTSVLVKGPDAWNKKIVNVNQLGVGTVTPDLSSAIEIKSTTQGFLPPRMTYVQKLAIISPASGLIIWCSNCGVSGEIQVFNGSTWTNIIGGFTTASLPIISLTTSVYSITKTTATSGGSVTSDGGATITSRGVCWSTKVNPTVAFSTKTIDGTGTGVFSSSLTGLSADSTYYVRAYATNSIGTSYGSSITFSTITNHVVPTLTTVATTNVATTTATSGGNVTADGGTIIIARGVCWSTKLNPTIVLNTKTTNGTGTGIFSSSLTGLNADSTYYVRAYSTNSAGTSYGNGVTFTTLANPIVPTLSTTTATNINQTTATSGGNITADGGAAITARGVCWSTSGNPTIALSTKTSNGTGTGAFTSSLTGLTAGITYYVKAYVTNSAGTSYGNTLTFTTLANPVVPILTTIAVTNIAQTTATGGGNATSDGGAAITARGICWNTTKNPTISNFKTAMGTGTGTFTSVFTGLTANTTYYVRAYVTNNIATTYGNEITFKTYYGEVTDIDGNIYPTVKIGNQIWMAENLKTTKYNDGTSISNVIDNTAWADLTTGAYCWYNNDAATYKATYGALYNWYSVSTNKIAPTGWHVPTNADWTILFNYLGGASVAGGKLKESGTVHWPSPNIGATNESGFAAIPFAIRFNDGSFRIPASNGYWDAGYWWSFNEVSAEAASSIPMFNFEVGTGVGANNMKLDGFSVRCILGTLNPPTVTTAAISNLTSSSISCSGSITNDGGTAIAARGVCWSTAVNPTIALSTKTSCGTGIGTFSSSLTGLTAGTNYYVRAYATNSAGPSYGNSLTFTTLANPVVPTLSTTAATNITQTTATSGGNVTADGGAAITARGVCWSTAANPTVALSTKTSDGIGTGVFSSSLSGLTAGTTYYLRAYATNSAGTAYGPELSFKTSIANSGTTVTDIDGNVYHTVTIGTQVWMAENLKTTKYRNGDLIETTTLDITDENAPKYQWAYDGNISNADIYGRLYTWYVANDSRGACPIGWKVPSASDLFDLNMNSGDANDAGYFLKEKGTTHWNAPTNDPTNSLVTNRSGFTGLPSGGRLTDGIFYALHETAVFCTTDESSSTVGQSRNLNATNLNNIFVPTALDKKFGISVRCLKDDNPAGVVLPTLNTETTRSITTNSAISGGNISSDGGAAITARGVCWNTTVNPTIASSTKTSDGTGTGVFTSSLTGLTAGTNYYVRAYATNSAGTSYGNELTFATLANPVIPTLTTSAVTNITQTTATSGGNVTSDGGATITVRGVCWSTAVNPTIALGTKTSDGTGTGIFSNSLTGLTQGTSYYIRAYATNSAGTAYGAELSFKTTIANGGTTVTDIDGNVYHTVTIGTQVWMVENLSTTKYRNGDPIPNVTDDNTWYNLKSGAYRWMYNSEAIYKATYGGLYNWYTVADKRNIAPTGWHVPTIAEWKTLTDFLGGEIVAGGKLKEAGTTHWNSPNINATNLSGFTGLPSGSLDKAGTFGNYRKYGLWWSSTELKTYADFAYILSVGYTSSGTGLSTYEFESGLSVRCLKDDNPVSVVIPTIITTATSSMISTSASSGGNISSDGGAAITARGVCWSTSANPTVALSTKTSDGTGTGVFTSSLTGLTSGTNYYVRAYATNSAGTSYGNELTFTTLANPVVPTLTTAAATNITQTTATIGGNITADGGAPIAARGVCWSTSANPTVALSTKTSDGTGTGVFSSTLTRLTAGTNYNVRAYATNSAGTSYGNSLTFTTLANPVIPTLTTTAATNIAQSTATSGGNVTADGGATITARGVCWSTSANPTVALSTKTNDGTGTGVYSSSLTGLTQGTTYYIRAYATNSTGTGYGNQIPITTNITKTLPIVKTWYVYNIAQMTATGVGEISSDGNSVILFRGVCWNTSSNPTLANNKTTDGIGTRYFENILSRLTANTTYYLKAYATNSLGTSYGDEVTFKTAISGSSTNNDVDNNDYHTVNIGKQMWMTEDLKTTRYRNGDPILLNEENNLTWDNLIIGAYRPSTESRAYGAIYNWYAVADNRNIAPMGWHVATEADWTILIDFLGESAGGKLKEAGTSHWTIPNVGATNITGFTALPGLSFHDGAYYGGGGLWWTSTESGSISARTMGMSNNDDYVSSNSFKKSWGLCVRCVKD